MTLPYFLRVMHTRHHSIVYSYFVYHISLWGSSYLFYFKTECFIVEKKTTIRAFDKFIHLSILKFVILNGFEEKSLFFSARKACRQITLEY